MMLVSDGGGGTSVHVADTWQEWYDADSLNQITASGRSPAFLQFFSNFQVASPTQAPMKGFILRIPVKLAVNLPEGSFIQQGSAGIAACALLPTPVPWCAFTVIQYSVSLSVSVNNQVVQVVDPGIIGSPMFVSIWDGAGAQRDVNLLVWLQGSTPPDQVKDSNFMNSLCSGVCSIFNTNLLTNYVDLRSAVSQYQTTPFTVSVNLVEHYRAFQLYVSFGPLSAISAGFNLASYLTSPISTVDVDNGASGPAWFWFTATSGLSGLPTGTFATFTAPTRIITTDTNGNVVVVVTATTTTTCGQGYCAGFNERGYTVTIMQNPNNPLQELQCLLLPSWIQWLLCQSTWGYPNWALILIGILIIIFIVGLLVLAARRGPSLTRHRGSKGGAGGGGGKRGVTINIRIYNRGRKED